VLECVLMALHDIKKKPRGILKMSRGFLISTHGGTRTPNPRFRRPMLYPIELRTRRTGIVSRESLDVSILQELEKMSWKLVSEPLRRISETLL
jgi:hypothetical protein